MTSPLPENTPDAAASPICGEQASSEPNDEIASLPNGAVPGSAGTPPARREPGTKRDAENVPVDQDNKDLRLAVDNFLPATEPASMRSKPGPGLFESLAWTIGYLPVQVLAVGAIILLLAAIHGVKSGADQIPRFVHDLFERQQIPLLGGAQLLCVLVAVGVVALRLGKSTRRQLALVPIPPLHCFLILVFVVPLAMLSGQMHGWAMSVWEQFGPHAPWLEQASSMRMLEELSESTSLSVLIMIMAVAPALAEELVFRGVIGCGLVARWGLPAGVLMTSMLFAAVHLHPAHAVALMPLAIAIHLVYLATRSFWAPVLLHFMNNAWASVVMKYRSQFSAPELVEDVALPPEILLSATFCVLAVGALIWKTRVQYFHPDGSVWDPGYETAEQPPPDVEAVARRTRSPSWLMVLTAISIVMFAASVVQTSLPT
jgi:hypothetical protein